MSPAESISINSARTDSNPIKSYHNYEITHLSTNTISSWQEMDHYQKYPEYPDDTLLL